MRFPHALISMVILLYEFTALADRPRNDNFVDAISLAGTNLTVAGTNVDATREIGEPNHGAPGGKSVWWSWTAPDSGSVIIETTGSSFDTLLAAYTAASVNGLADALVASNDDSGSAETSLIVFNVTSGTLYHVVVDGYNGESGSIQLTISYRATPIPAAPLNDNFTNRIALTGLVVTARGANYFGTKESGEPAHASELGGSSVWWSWVASATGTVQVDTAGSSFDTLLGVYAGATVTNLTLVASNDDASTNTPTSLVTFPAIAGMTYQIAVDGFDGQPGDIVLHVQTSIVVLANPELLDNATYQFTVTGPLGKQYAIDASPDLVNWQRISTMSNPDGVLEFRDQGSPSSRRFYRAVQLP